MERSGGDHRTHHLRRLSSCNPSTERLHSRRILGSVEPLTNGRAGESYFLHCHRSHIGCGGDHGLDSATVDPSGQAARGDDSESTGSDRNAAGRFDSARRQRGRTRAWLGPDFLWLASASRRAKASPLRFALNRPPLGAPSLQTGIRCLKTKGRDNPPLHCCLVVLHGPERRR